MQEEKLAPLWLRIILTPPLLVLLFLHRLGLVFVASIIAAVLAGFGMHNAVALAYLSVAWKVYVGLIGYTFVFLTVFVFQNCCIGMSGFGRHLLHRKISGYGLDGLASVFWPFAWYRLDQNLKAWGSSLIDAKIGVFHFLFVRWWRKPPKVRQLDPEEFGGIQVYEVHDQDQLEQVLKGMLGDPPPPTDGGDDPPKT